MGKQGNKQNDNKDHKNKFDFDRQRRVLLSELMSEAKALRGSKVDKTKPSIRLLDFDIPTMELAVTIPEYKSYVESLIQAYNKYLGYDSGVTFDSIEKVFEYGLNLFVMMKVIFRYYESNEMILPTGEELNGIFDICTAPRINSDGKSEMVISSRLANTVKGISNKVWESDYISKVEQILLPSQVLILYNYYLGALFNISDDNSKEALTFVRFWPSIESAAFITYPSGQDAVFPQINKTKFDSAYNNLKNYLTPKVRDFIVNFLGWTTPHQDWTRPITSDRVYSVADSKLVSTLNQLFPEHVDAFITYEEAPVNLETTLIDNAWARYYYDFEIIGDSDNNEEFIATNYYFGIDSVNSEQYTLMENDELNDIKIDFNNYPLLCMLASEEISGSKAMYVGGIWSMLTKIDMTDGSYVQGRTSIDQIYMGNDLKFNIYDNSYDQATEAVNSVHPSQYACPFGDALEVAEYSENLKVFNYPIVVPEVWNVAFRDGDGVAVELHCGACVNGALTLYDPLSNLYSSDNLTRINHASDFVACDTYVLNVNETHLSIQTVLFSYISGFDTYTQAVKFIDDLFRGKQQETN